MLEPQTFVDVGGTPVERKRWRLRLGQHLDLGGGDLDRTGRELRVHRADGSGPHLAGHPHDPFGAESVRTRATR